jgi:hypothetical protein
MPLLAQKSVGDFVSQSLWAGIGLVVALLVLAWVVYRLRAWYGEDAGGTDGDRLTERMEP